MLIRSPPFLVTCACLFVLRVAEIACFLSAYFEGRQRVSTSVLLAMLIAMSFAIEVVLAVQTSALLKVAVNLLEAFRRQASGR